MDLGLVYDSVFLDHMTGAHPERPERLDSIYNHLEQAGIFKKTHRIEFKEVSRDRLRSVHSHALVERVFEVAADGGGRLDFDTVVCPHSDTVAAKAVGAGIAAVDAVSSGTVKRAMCLVRPPGHHATPTHSMGFCLFNNIAIAAEYLLEKESADKVAIVDFDVHHGNGTQDVFYERGDLFFFSIHQYPHYPGTGPSREKGSGEGEGTNLNAPLGGGVSTENWMTYFESGLDRIAAYDPDFILVSAGFDSHRDDPLGDFPLTEEDFGHLAERIQQLANGKGVVSFLEGGYNLEALGRSVTAYLQAQL
jgi:acetoin utilization deacetylase AcuC-like enzyme